MEKNRKSIFMIIGIITVLVGLACAAAAIVYKIEKKRRDEKELDEYIENAIL